MQEIWKDVLDYEGLYQVSDFGNIKSLRFNKEKILKPTLGKRGYFVVNLFKDKIITQKTVHRLVWEAFNGKTDLDVDHKIEGNKLDNRLSNLQVLSQRENTSKYFINTKKTSIFTGVSWDKHSKRWEAQIYIGGKNIKLGKFLFETEAYRAYLRAKDCMTSQATT